MNMRDMTALKNIVRIGTVSSVNIPERTARVVFEDKRDTEGKPLVSGPLKVIQSPPFIPRYYDTQETELRGGGSGEPAFASHTHELVIKPWLPYVGQTVVCLYLANGESDGFVIGAI